MTSAEKEKQVHDVDTMQPEVGEFDQADPSGASSTEPPLKQRETWGRQIDFLLALIGFSVGLGNVWRFPYLCYKNGGGAFLLPYLLCVLIGGVPVLFLEVALGQYMQVGGLGIWNICPLFKGIGFATTIIVSLVNIYYNIILAWAFYYLFSSFTSSVPWDSCHNWWNTANCSKLALMGTTNSTSWGNETTSWGNETTSWGNETTSLGNETMSWGNETMQNVSRTLIDPVTEFWERKVLGISTGIDDPGTVKWDLALCLLLSWTVVYMCIWKGIKSSGKVMYFTATSPYLIMLMLLIRSATLPGALEGVKYYIIPEWSRLADPEVWVDAGTQIFFSYSISLGTLTALGSYNNFHHDSYKHSIMFACVNSGTSIFAGFLIFSTLGFMAHEQNIPISDVAEAGPGLAFIAYPKALAQMPIAPLWSILFFIMIILLGLDSQFVGVEGFVTAIVDEFPQYLRRGHRKELFILAVCIVSFFFGLSMVTNGGMYVFQIFDYYAGSRIILLVGFLECVVVAWIYGVGRFYDNMTWMYGYRINPFMKYSWLFTAPLFTLIIFALCIYSYSELTYNKVYIYPKWAIGLGWTLACISIIMVPIVMIYQLTTVKGTLIERVKILIKPIPSPHHLKGIEETDESTLKPPPYDVATLPEAHVNPAFVPSPDDSKLTLDGESKSTLDSQANLYNGDSQIWHVTNV